MAFVSVYNKIGRLKMVHTGNALGLNQNPRVGNDTTQTLMITLDSSTVVAGAGVPASTLPTTYAGNTRDWTKSGSWSNLTLPSSIVPVGSTIDHARLIWQTNYGSSPQPTLAFCQTTPVNFITPDSVVYTLAPQTTDNSGFQKVANSVDVTTILNALISSGYDRALGDYAVTRVPISVQVNVAGGSGGAGYVGAGWGLVIFYTHPDLIYNSETLYVGDLPNDTTQNITGFYTPEAGNVTARIYTQACLSSAVEGDTLRVNTTGQANLFASGPNNPFNPPYPINNFLSSTICDYLGNISYIGSYGNNNSNPQVFNAGTGVKTEFTITNVPINNYLKNSSRSATIFSTGDISSLGAFGLEVQVNQAFFAPTKTSNKSIYNPGETVSYTLNFPNTGGTTATNVVFVDTLPSNLTFVPGTIRVNGVLRPSSTLNSVTLPNIGTGSSVSVTFDATINSSISSTTTIPNIGWIGYNFIPDPSLPESRDANTSNTNIVTVFKSSLSSTKTVNKSFADVGETLNYTIVLNNTGTNTYSNVIFKDTIPTGTTFVSGSFEVNSVTSPSNPSAGVSLGTINANSITTIKFSVGVGSSVPSPNPIPNSSTLTGVYNDDFGNTTPVSLNSNTVNTLINTATISTATKSVNTLYASVGETLTYTIVLRNTGNVSSTNVTILDTIPTGSSFVSDSLKVNGVTIPGANPQPPTGTNIGYIDPGSTSTVTFNVLVSTIPSPSRIVNNSSITYDYTIDPTTPTTSSKSISTNSVTTTISYSQIDFASGGFTKTVNKSYSSINSTLTYTLVLKNTGNTTANNVTIIDTIPSATVFIPNTFKINTVTQPGASPLPPSGVDIGSVGPNQTQTVSFDVNVTTIPTVNPMVNNATAVFRFTGDPSFPNSLISSGTSSSVNVQVNTADLSGITKSVDNVVATIGDELTYTVVIPNTGNITAINVVLKDTIPNGTSLVPNSFYIDSNLISGANPTLGVTLPNISPQTTITVKFKVRVTGL